MTILLLLILPIALWKSRFTGKDFHPDCLGKDSTTAINGIFVLLVFLRHFSQYISYGRLDAAFSVVDKALGQLIVTPFLFFSGYGIFCSIRKKGISYVNQIPTKRFCKVWLHFAMAIVLFVITRRIVGKNDSLQQILWSFTGWKSIGNSNWYIFATLALYLMTFAAFRISRCRQWPGIVMTGLFTCLFIVVMGKYKSAYWFDTVLSFPAGMAVAAIRPKVSQAMHKNKVYWPVLLVFLGALLLFFRFRKVNVWVYEGLAVLFACTVLLITEKLVIGNPILRFLGTYTFEIYILQRIPMILLEHFMPIKGVWKAPYFLLSFAATIGLSLIFRKACHYPDKLLDKVFSK